MADIKQIKLPNGDIYNFKDEYIRNLIALGLVNSINGKTGVATLNASDVGALSSTTTYVKSVNGSSGVLTFPVPPSVSSSDNGKVLTVAGGNWVAANPVASAPISTATITNIVNGTYN